MDLPIDPPKRLKCKTKHLVYEHGRWVEGWEGDYSVTDSGEVWTFKGTTAYPLKPQIDKQGYARVTFSRDKKIFKPTIHALVMLTWGPPPPEGRHCILHKNANKADNKMSNLTWWQGPKPGSGIREGEFIHNNKYSQYTAQRAWDMMIAGVPRTQIMAELNVPYSFLAGIASGLKWKCLDRGGLTKLPYQRKTWGPRIGG